MHKLGPVLCMVLVSQKSCCALTVTGRWEWGRPNMNTRVQTRGGVQLSVQPLHHLPCRYLSPHWHQCSRSCERITSVYTASERFSVTFTTLTDSSHKTKCWMLSMKIRNLCPKRSRVCNRDGRNDQNLNHSMSQFIIWFNYSADIFADIFAWKKVN